MNTVHVRAVRLCDATARHAESDAATISTVMFAEAVYSRSAIERAYPSTGRSGIDWTCR